MGKRRTPRPDPAALRDRAARPMREPRVQGALRGRTAHHGQRQGRMKRCPGRSGAGGEPAPGLRRGPGRHPDRRRPGTEDPPLSLTTTRRRRAPCPSDRRASRIGALVGPGWFSVGRLSWRAGACRVPNGRSSAFHRGHPPFPTGAPSCSRHEGGPNRRSRPSESWLHEQDPLSNQRARAAHDGRNNRRAGLGPSRPGPGQGQWPAAAGAADRRSGDAVPARAARMSKHAAAPP